MDDKQFKKFIEHVHGRFETLNKKRRITKEDIAFEREFAESQLGFPVSYATMHDQLFWDGFVKERYYRQ